MKQPTRKQVLEALEDMYVQFAYVAKVRNEPYDTPQGKCDFKIPVAWHSGGLSALEYAESALVACGRLEKYRKNGKMEWYKLTRKEVK